MNNNNQQTTNEYIKVLAKEWFNTTNTDITCPSVYILRNKINDKRYIGKSKSPLARVYYHISGLANTSWFINKNNYENFEIEFLQMDTMEEAKEYENFFIEFYDTLNNGYNQYSENSKGSKHFFSNEEIDFIYERFLQGIKNQQIKKEFKEQFNKTISDSRISFITKGRIKITRYRNKSKNSINKTTTF
jgi:predicted GIY-YIG superfamily endonuclease